MADPGIILRRIANNKINVDEDSNYKQSCSPDVRALAAGVLVEREQSHYDRRQRFVLSVAWMAVVVACAFLLSCCSRPLGSSSPTTFGVEDEKAAAVELRVRCVAGVPFAIVEDDGTPKLYRAGDDFEMARGSGVLVSSNQILTAEHVADLSSVPPFLHACALYAYFPSGRRYQLSQEYGSREYDVARFRASVGVFYEFDRAPLVAPPPAAGEDVCLAPAFPMRLRRCGEVQYVNGKPPGDVVHVATTEPGNSGGAAYDRSGHLVGIVTHLWKCVNGQICGGKVQSIRPEFLK